MSIKVSSWQSAVGGKLILSTILLIASCLLPLVSNAQRNKNKEAKPHHEDLTALRLKFPEVKDSTFNREEAPKMVSLPASNSVHVKVNEVLDSMARFNKTKMFMDGFTIQIYSGLKKEDALNAKKTMVEQANDLPSDLKYQQPKWRVITGSYLTRLEAQKDLHRLKRIFPAAILVPEKVALR